MKAVVRMTSAPRIRKHQPDERQKERKDRREGTHCSQRSEVIIWRQSYIIRIEAFINVEVSLIPTTTSKERSDGRPVSSPRFKSKNR